MEDKRFRKDISDLPPIVDLDQIKNPTHRKEFEEMEVILRELDDINDEIEESLRRQGLL